MTSRLIVAVPLGAGGNWAWRMLIISVTVFVYKREGLGVWAPWGDDIHYQESVRLGLHPHTHGFDVKLDTRNK